MRFSLLQRSLFCVFLLVLYSCKKPDEPERYTHPLPKDVSIVESVPGRYGGILVVAGAAEPKTFNPFVSEDAYSSQAINSFLSGLVDYDSLKQEHVPGLARHWERSVDRKQYTFYLRQGIRWSDGHPFTADDVIFTFDIIFDPRYPNRYSQQYTIAGQPLAYEKLDDFSVRFSTADTYAPFINDIGFISILPKHILYDSFQEGSFQKKWSVQTALDEPETLVGTGPFSIDSYRPGERIIFAPNPHYWKADAKQQRLPYIDYFVTKFVPDVNIQTLLFATGQSDAIGQISGTDLAWVSKAQDIYNFSVIEQGPAYGISFIWFNLKPGENEKGRPYVAPHKLKWFQEKKFRQAIAYGFDRQGIINAVYSGLGQPLDSIISPANRKWHNAQTRRYDYNPEKAKTLLQELGMHKRQDGILIDSKGNSVTFELIVSKGSANTKGISTTFKENMKALGIEVTLIYPDFGTLVKKISQTNDYEACFLGFTGGGDPSGGKAIYRSDGRMHLWHPEQVEPATEWEARIDKLMDEQERELDEQKRIALIYEIQKIFSEEVPLIFLITPTVHIGIKNKWQNIHVPSIGSPLWNIDQIWMLSEDD